MLLDLLESQLVCFGWGMCYHDSVMLINLEYFCSCCMTDTFTFMNSI